MKKNKKRKDKNEIWSLIKKILGIFFIILGVLGLFLPFLEGILFILLGLALYHNESIKDVILNFRKKVKKWKIKDYGIPNNRKNNRINSKSPENDISHT